MTRLEAQRGEGAAIDGPDCLVEEARSRSGPFAAPERALDAVSLETIRWTAVEADGGGGAVVDELRLLAPRESRGGEHPAPAPTSAALYVLSATLAHRIGHFLERRCFIERDVENAPLAGNHDVEAAALEQLRAASITYRTALSRPPGAVRAVDAGFGS